MYLVLSFFPSMCGGVERCDVLSGGLVQDSCFLPIKVAIFSPGIPDPRTEKLFL